MDTIKLHDFCEYMGFNEAAEDLLKPCWAQLLQETEEGVPGFMRQSFYRHYYPLCKGPDDVPERMDKVAEILAKEPLAARYAAMLHYGLYCADPQMPLRYMPLPTKIFGENAGIFHLMVVLSSLPLIEEKYKAMGLAPEMFQNMSIRIGGGIASYAVAHDGIPGYAPGGCAWFRHFIDGRLFRLGRLEFMFEVWRTIQPVVYRHKQHGSLAVLCQNNWMFDKDGLLVDKKAQAYFISRLKITADSITGTPLNDGGLPEFGEERTLFFDEWESVCTPWDLVLDVHIPAGDKMTLEKLRDSFQQAILFFQKQFQMKVSAFRCGSWLLNPDLAKELPDSNLAAFQRNVHLGPISNSPGAGLSFVYGDAHADPMRLPAVNSLHRAFQRLQQRNIPLKSGMMFLLASEVDSIGK